MFSRGLRKAFGASIKGKDLFICCPFLRRKDMCSSILTTKWIGNIRRYREANVIQFTHIVPIASFGKGCD